MRNISIITINLNNKLGLERTIESVLNQSYKNFEFILIDGASSDGSIEFIQKKSDSISYWISEKDNGIYDAMNKGIAKATGKYLMFLNSGDILYGNDALRNCINYMGGEDFDVLYGNIINVINNREYIWAHPRKMSISFFKKNNLCHQSALIKADLFKIYGLYPEKYTLAGDHWIFLISFVNNKKYLFAKDLLIKPEPSGAGIRGHDIYQEEMAHMWSKLVPNYVTVLVDNYLSIEYANRYPFLKNIVGIHDFVIYKKKYLLFYIILIFSVIASIVLIN